VRELVGGVLAAAGHLVAESVNSLRPSRNNGTRSPGNGSGVRSASGTGRSDAPWW
jgi:hypothetical protein